MIKRLLDIIFSLFGLVISSPVILMISILVGTPVFYFSKRVGKGGKVFNVVKFRTMVVDADKKGGPSTSADDPRLTKIGKFLREHNLDELPQLWNVLKGEMSFIGPRPEVPSEVETYPEGVKKEILSVKPGMTDLATLADIHEEEILKGSQDPHKTYREKIKPQKIRLAMRYVKERSLWLDFKIFVKTLLSALF